MCDYLWAAETRMRAKSFASGRTLPTFIGRLQLSPAEGTTGGHRQTPFGIIWSEHRVAEGSHPLV